MIPFEISIDIALYKAIRLYQRNHLPVAVVARVKERLQIVGCDELGWRIQHLIRINRMRDKGRCRFGWRGRLRRWRFGLGKGPICEWTSKQDSQQGQNEH